MALALFASLVIGGAAAAERPMTRAVGGRDLLRGVETARRTVVAHVESVDALDSQGYRATLAVERDLASPTDAPPGETVTIGWEELAKGRPPRFQVGDRVLVALEPLPGYSLWRRRFPDGKALAVAAKGAAFLREFDAGTVEALARYLRVAPDERSEAPGIEALAQLVANAVDPVAIGAADRLADIPGIATKLREPAAAALSAAIASPERSAARRRKLLALAASRRLDDVRPSVIEVTKQGPPLAGVAWSTLAAIDGGLPVETVKRLLDDPDPGVRAVAVREAAGTSEQPRAIAAIRRDPAPEVRSAAVEAMVATRDEAALDAGYAALFDRDTTVRLAASKALGALGADVVPKLRELALGRDGEAATGPLAALSYAGAEGQAALLELAHTHPDEKARGLARMLLGLDPRKP